MIYYKKCHVIFNKIGTKQHHYGVKRHNNSRTPTMFSLRI